MKVIIYDTEEHAKQADWASNKLTGSVSRYRYARKLLTDTTTLTRDEYAELYGIPETVKDENGVTEENPKYTALSSSYTLNKCALLVGDDHDIHTVNPDDTVTVTVPSYVVDVSTVLLQGVSE